MNFILFNKWSVFILSEKYHCYAITPYVEYDRISGCLYFCFWKWRMEIDIEKIEKGGDE